MPCPTRSIAYRDRMSTRTTLKKRRIVPPRWVKETSHPSVHRGQPPKGPTWGQRGPTHLGAPPHDPNCSMSDDGDGEYDEHQVEAGPNRGAVPNALGAPQQGT